VPARWYWAPQGAPQLIGPHAFGSSVWLKDWEQPQGPGEVDRVRGLDRGLNTGYQAQCRLGKDKWFADGQLPQFVLDPDPPPFPVCCWAGISAPALLTLTPAGRMLHVGVLERPAPLLLVANGAFYQRDFLHGQAMLTLSAHGAAAEIDALAGHAGLGLSPRADVVQRWTLTGDVSLALSAHGTAAEIDALAGHVGLALSARSTWYQQDALVGRALLQLSAHAALAEHESLAGHAGLSLSARSVAVPRLYLVGRATLTLSPKGTLKIPPKIAGKATMQLAPNAKFSARITTCTSCLGGAPLQWNFPGAGFGGGLSGFNAAFKLGYVNLCNWSYAVGNLSISLQSGLIGGWTMTVSNLSTGAIATYAGPLSFACLGNNLFTLVSVLGGAAPSSITISPV
jgi:hypothetical protein